MSGAAAIVGIGCRFPGGADTPERFWALLRDGVDAIREVPPERFDLERVFDPDPAREGTTYSRWGGFVDGVDLFDAGFFGFSPREASRIDPQHRLLLETAYEATEDAGIPLERLAGSRTGVFVGLSTKDYGDMQMYPANRRLIDAHSNSGGAGSIAANRISYVFDLRGPSMTVDTACSSSLTAAHLALGALRAGECDAAIVGGAMLILTAEPTIGFAKASMLSPDGRCKAFSAAANGYVRADGVGAVLLRPLADALADGDRIYAVLRGTAVNQDGRTKGMTVPSAAAQEAMLRAGLADARLEPAAVQYVEAHGTGTPVGDPQEATALGAVFGPGRTNGERCAIGSVKTNIGHAEAGAGMAGLIKTALALHHRQLPPSLHFDEPSPEFDLDALRLRVVTGLEPWPATGGAVARAAVNSFGFGGANANAVLEQAPERAPSEAVPADGPLLLPVSARSPEALAGLAGRYAELLRGGASPQAVARASSRRRSHHDHRVAVVGTTAEELAAQLDLFASGGRAGGHRTRQRLAFVYSGMGPQWWAMGRELHEREPVFQAALERVERAFADAGGWSLLGTLLADETDSHMAEPDVAQAANFALQVALTDLLAARGIVPDAVLGHSAGEMAAAYAAGALSLEDAALVTYHRSRLQARAAGEGTMLAAAVDEAEAERLVAPWDGRVTLGAVNAPRSVTLSGDAEVLERIAAELTERDVFARILRVTVPFHSRAMDPILDELAERIAPIRPEPPRIVLVSPLTGLPVAGADLDARYWCRAVREPVHFADAVDALLDDGVTAFVELAPHPVLGPSVGECVRERGATALVVPTLRRGEPEREAVLSALGALYTAGIAPAWEALHPGPVPHEPLPPYPWQRERHWLEALAIEDPLPAADPTEHPLLGRRVRSVKPLWETSFADPRLAYLDDHVVGGTVPFPGAGYVEMGLAASRRLLGHAAPGVRDVEFRRALFLGAAEAPVVQLAVDPDTHRFEVHSAPPGAEWTLHTDGTVAGGRPTERRTDLSELELRLGARRSHDEIYARLEDWGFVYGPAFKGIEWAAAADGESVGEVALDLDVERYELHPALFDAALQLLIVAADSTGDATSAAFLPVRVGEVRVNRPPGKRFRVHARTTRRGDVAGDVDVLDADGNVLVEVRGLECRFLEGGARAETVADWLYEWRWEEAPSAGLDTGTLAGLAPAVEGSDWAVYYDDVEPLLDEAAAAYARAALDAVPEPARPRLAEALRELVAAHPDPRPAAGLLRGLPSAYAVDAALAWPTSSRAGSTPRTSSSPATGSTCSRASTATRRPRASTTACSSKPSSGSPATGPCACSRSAPGPAGRRRTCSAGSTAAPTTSSPTSRRTSRRARRRSWASRRRCSTSSATRRSRASRARSTSSSPRTSSTPRPTRSARSRGSAACSRQAARSS
jgi:acyl transferase domain-containing protein